MTSATAPLVKASVFGTLPRDIVPTHIATRPYASGLVQSEYLIAG